LNNFFKKIEKYFIKCKKKNLKKAGIIKPKIIKQEGEK